MAWERTRTLGRTGLKVGRLGLASSYGAPAEAFEEAFEKGCNYFYWGWKRDRGMREALRNLLGQGKRDQLIMVIQSYSRSAYYLERSYVKALKMIGADSGDVMLLGWHNKPPSERVLDRAIKMRDKGIFKHLAVSGHNRMLFPQLALDERFDLFHIRYNAAHRGAETEVFPKFSGDLRPGVATYTATRWGRLINPKKMPAGEIAPSASDCYRFVLTNSSVDVCMTGPRDRRQMQEALTALDLGPLPEDELKRLSRIGDHVRGKGKSGDIAHFKKTI